MLNLSPLGFGVSGAHGTPLVRRTQTVSLIHRAARAGVRVFDTAPAYGAGEAEIRLGLALKSLDRSGLVISTKAGLTSYGLTGRRRDFSPAAIETSLTASLTRLGVEGVDLLILHGVSHEELSAPLQNRLETLKAAGAYQALGMAGRGLSLDEALEVGWFTYLMTPVHPFLDEDEQAVLARARAMGVNVIAIETAGDAPASPRTPRSMADLYPVFKHLHGAAHGRGRIGVTEGLRVALASGLADTVLFTTTRRRHLDVNLSVAEAL